MNLLIAVCAPDLPLGIFLSLDTRLAVPWSQHRQRDAKQRGTQKKGTQGRLGQGTRRARERGGHGIGTVMLLHCEPNRWGRGLAMTAMLLLVVLRCNAAESWRPAGPGADAAAAAKELLD